MINNFKIGTHLLGGFLVLALMLLVMALIDHLNIKSVNAGMATLFADRTLPIQNFLPLMPAYWIHAVICI